jgi:hypothetical protein
MTDPLVVRRAFASVARTIAPASSKLVFPTGGSPQPAVARGRAVADEPASEPEIKRTFVERVEQPAEWQWRVITWLAIGYIITRRLRKQTGDPSV